MTAQTPEYLAPDAPVAQLPDARSIAAVRWAAAQGRGVLEAAAPASADASFRRYFRIYLDGCSYIVMDAPPEQEDSRPFIKIALLMREAGLRVPEVHAADLGQGFLLLGDLGTRTYLEVMNAGNAGAYFGRARAALLRWQAATRPGALPDYSEALLRRESGLFAEWYLGRHLSVTLEAEEAAALAEVERLLARRALAQPQVFVHRDFMPRNLMDGDEQAGVLDFQDAVLGPVSYDAISLYRDAFASWPAELVEEELARYHEQARAAGIPVPEARADFFADCDWMGLQRHLKVLGIFARLGLRDGKRKYLEDTPRFVDYVMQVAPRYRELQPLAALMARRVLPRL